MTKAFVMAAVLVALTLAMQEVALGQDVDPLADLKSVRLKKVEARPAAKRPDQRVAVPAQPAPPVVPSAEEVEIRPNTAIGFIPLAGGSFTTTGPAGSAPPAPPPQAQRAAQPSSSARQSSSSPWSNMWWGFN